MTKIEYLKEKFNNFLKENNAFDAWYERYRLDNAMYGDEVPIEKFLTVMVNGGEHHIHSMFYCGIQGTCMCTNEGDKFIEDNKQCDILSNGTIADLDEKWMNSWKEYINLDELNKLL